jgi:ElaB/YqjD/DUF883 family membrane-anchored ribosome-binding protein
MYVRVRPFRSIAVAAFVAALAGYSVDARLLPSP